MPPLTLLSGKSALCAMAADAEYGEHLRRLITPLMIGVGPVEAGINLALALAELKAAGSLPDLVLSLGSAGSSRLPRANVFQVASVVYRDMDASPFGFERHVTPFLDLPATLPLGPRIPGVDTATLSTGGSVIAGEGFAAIEEDMVDMETYACLRACRRFGVPMIGLRGISDGDAPVDDIDDWLDHLHHVDRNLASAVEALAAAIANHDIAL